MEIIDMQLQHDLTWFEKNRRDILYHQAQGYVLADDVLRTRNRIGRAFTSQRQVDAFKHACTVYRARFK